MFLVQIQEYDVSLLKYSVMSAKDKVRNCIQRWRLDIGNLSKTKTEDFSEKFQRFLLVQIFLQRLWQLGVLKWALPPKKWQCPFKNVFFFSMDAFPYMVLDDYMNMKANTLKVQMAM